MNPFATDSIFGRGTPGLAALESRRTFATLPLHPANQLAAEPAHQCGGLCGLDCAWTNDTRRAALTIIDGDDGIADSVELAGPVNYAYLLRRNSRFVPSLPPGLPKYRTDGELFDDAVPLAAPAVIGEVYNNTPAGPRPEFRTRRISPRDAFNSGLRMMRTAKTPGDRERGFQLIAPHAARFVKELIDGFVTELNDHTLRYRLLELIAKARAPEAFAVLATQLHSPDETLRYWAIRGLELLNTHETRALLARFGESVQRTA